jgi:hypothetical protein
MGALESNRYPKGEKLKLQNCDIVKELNGLTFDDLSPALRIKVKRSYVRMQIIKKESPKRLKYDMFKRLNTGGLLLSAQEIRNTTIRLLDEHFIDFIQSLKSDINFRKAISSVSEEAINEQYDDELILRFFTLKNGNITKYSGSLADYMTTFAEEVSDKSSEIDFNYAKEKTSFERTFQLLNTIMPNGKIFTSGVSGGYKQQQFLGFQYEAFALGVSKFQDKISTQNKFVIDKMKKKFDELKKNPQFIEVTKNEKQKRTSGSQYVKYLNERISFVATAIQSCL